MKLWKVYIYNYFGELSRCWYFSSRIEANECGEYFREAMDGSYEVNYAGNRKYAINANDKAVVFPFDDKTSDGKTVFFDSFEDFMEIFKEVGALFKGRF